MLRPLLYLSALLTLPCVAGQTFSTSTQLDISSCPITYFGKKYTQLYVSFTAQNHFVCFDGLYNPQAAGDCVLGPPAAQITYISYPSLSNIQTLIYQNLMTISNKLQCLHYLSTGSGGFFIANFGTQAALMFSFTPKSTAVATVLVNGVQVNKVTLQTSQTYAYADLSSCRYGGVVYKPSTSISIPSNCTTVTCDSLSVLHTNSCGPTQTCIGNNQCITTTTVPTTTTLPPIVNSICTVTGPTVIDFKNNLNSVKDRCAYSLLQIPSVPGFQVVGSFLDRRLTDVSFLDSLWLKVNGVIFQLKQGGRVLMNNTPLTLSSSPQTFNGVTLSKDPTGVTAVLSLPNFIITIFFDGYTSNILVEGRAGSPLQGLCENSNSAPRVSDYSPLGCQTQYPNTDNSWINLINKTDSCYLLEAAPFTSCGIDPQPYVDACTDTLSIYPAVDALRCQFLEAYAKACSLKLNYTLDDWRLKTNCLLPQAFCQDSTCSDNEFCGETSVGGATRCFCRPIFASSYRQIKALGDPTVCIKNTASITLVNCLLEDKGIDYSVLHLNDPTCRGQMDKNTHLVTFGFNSTNCGTTVTTNSSQIIYSNAITSQNKSSNVIIRQSQVSIKLSCFQIQPDIRTVMFKIKDSSVVEIISAGLWNYTLTMKAYTDAFLKQAVDQSTDVFLNQQIWVQLDTTGLDANELALVTDSCWATDQPSATASLRYNLIENSCPNPADSTVVVQKNGVGTSNQFYFNMFEFSEGPSEVYLHCSVHLCIKQNGCIPVCNGARRRRSFRSKLESAALIGMSWAH